MEPKAGGGSEVKESQHAYIYIRGAALHLPSFGRRPGSNFHPRGEGEGEGEGASGRRSIISNQLLDKNMVTPLASVRCDQNILQPPLPVSVRVSVGSSPPTSLSSSLALEVK